MPFIGTDLGTSNSAAAVLRGGRPVIIPSAEGVTLGGKAFPSYVAISGDGLMLVGEAARRQVAANPEGTKTTDIHLPRRIGEALRRAYEGELDYHYDEESHFIRVTWRRDA